MKDVPITVRVIFHNSDVYKSQRVNRIFRHWVFCL